MRRSMPKGHIAGSINIALGGQYATWAGTVLDRTRPIVIIAEPGREQEAALRLGRIGFDHVKGYLRDGMGALAERQDLVWATERVSPGDPGGRAGRRENPPLVIDIRNPGEWKHETPQRQRQPAALRHLQERIEEVPRTRRIAVHCAGGYRSSIAVSILNQYGITNLIELAGGITAWEAAQVPGSGGIGGYAVHEAGVSLGPAKHRPCYIEIPRGSGGMAAGIQLPGNDETIDLQQQVARLQALLEASRQVHSTIREEEVLEQVLRIVVRELEMAGAAFPGTGLDLRRDPELDADAENGAALPIYPACRIAKGSGWRSWSWRLPTAAS